MSSFFESVAARLVPFDFTVLGSERANPTHPLHPIFRAGGLVFPYTPTINESIKVQYDKYDLIHSNESYYAYKSTENRRITISNAVFTCDTPENAQYALAAIHFFWIYSLMDFGKGRSGRPPSPMWFSAYGNYAFNNVPVLMESCDIQWPDNKEVDYVRVPNIGRSATAGLLGQVLPIPPPQVDLNTPALRDQLAQSNADADDQQQFLNELIASGGSQDDIDIAQQSLDIKVGQATQLASALNDSNQQWSTFNAASVASGSTSSSGDYTWLPMKLEITNITLIVQHSPKFWKAFDLKAYRSGKMASRDGSTDANNPVLTGGFTGGYDQLASGFSPSGSVSSISPALGVNGNMIMSADAASNSQLADAQGRMGSRLAQQRDLGTNAVNAPPGTFNPGFTETDTSVFSRSDSDTDLGGV